MLHLILHEPEIPPNTGNIIRLCANTGSTLHLIHPLGFSLDDKRLRRAGLDYHDLAPVKHYDSFESLLGATDFPRLWALSVHGQRAYHDLTYTPEDALLFGSETSGLPPHILSHFGPEQVLRIPMVPESRSLNLSNAVAVVLYEAWRQLGFPGGR